MNAFSMIDMQEATRLTREGRLAEAMSLLQGAPSGGPATTRRAEPMPRTSNGDMVLDMQPPTKAGGAWTAPVTNLHPDGLVGRTPSPKTKAGLQDSVSRPVFNLMPMGMGNPPPRAPLVSGARFEDRTFANGAGARAYKLYVPSGFAGDPLPLVVMLHGCTQSPDDFAAGTQMNALAEENLFLVAYPAQPPSANAQKCWNWFNAGDQHRDHGEPALIAGITREIMGEFPVDERRVYIAGLSAGGAAAAIMGSTYPDLYAAIGVHSGLACGAASDMPSAFSAMRQGGRLSATENGRVIPTIVFHGDRDTTVSAVNGDQVIAQSKAGANLRVDVSSGSAKGGLAYTRTIHCDREDKPVLEQWVLHGAGHAWSGGSSAGSYTDPRGPDASREMVRFFLHHQTHAAVS
jgi:poly(hydroxyalkanoate) depolymerase family esterase